MLPSFAPSRPRRRAPRADGPRLGAASLRTLRGQLKALETEGTAARPPPPPDGLSVNIGEYQVERLWRDAKLIEIGGGTLEAHQKNITRELAKELRDEGAGWQLV